MVKIAIIINGYATVGKDEFIKQAISHCDEYPDPAYRPYISSMSSIEPVRQMLRDAGFPVDTKTPEMRRLLAVVGTAVEEFNGWRTSRCVEEADNFLNPSASMLLRAHAPRFFFIHMRESVYIARTIKKLEEKQIKVKTLLIQRNGVEPVTSNEADMDVMNTKYDYRIGNNGSLQDLKKSAAWFIYSVLRLDTAEA